MDVNRALGSVSQDVYTFPCRWCFPEGSCGDFRGLGVVGGGGKAAAAMAMAMGMGTCHEW